MSSRVITEDLSAINSIAARAGIHWAEGTFDAQKQPFLALGGSQQSALRFLTCGSVDDGKSTLMGRLLIDSRAVTDDQLASVQRSGKADLALLTDGLQAEREQGITIDVAYRYFQTARRKFIMADAPGHAQYTRNMVTAASSADAAVVLVDATKLAWQPGDDSAALLPALLPQTRRHTLLAQLLRVPSVVFVVNKLDAVGDAATAFERIRAALLEFAGQAGIAIAATVPISALLGWNVSQSQPGWCGYHGPALLAILEGLPAGADTDALTAAPFALPVQWVEKADAASSKGRIFWGRAAAGAIAPGHTLRIMPGGQSAGVAQLLGNNRQPLQTSSPGQSCGVVLDREIDVSRGDWLLQMQSKNAEAEVVADDADVADLPHPALVQHLTATVAWLDEEALSPGRSYWLLHGHRWIKAKVERINYQLDIETLARQPAQSLPVNSIGEVRLHLREPLAAVLPYARSRSQGALVLVDTASHRTAGAVMVVSH